MANLLDPQNDAFFRDYYPGVYPPVVAPARKVTIANQVSVANQAAASGVAIKAQNDASYMYSANLLQAIVAGVEAAIIPGADHAILVGFLVLLSSMVPPSGIFNVYGINEKLWETLIATFIGGAILKAVAGGQYWKKAGMMLIIDASSMAITDEIYTAFILEGNNANYFGYRLSYPEANAINRAFLG